MAHVEEGVDIDRSAESVADTTHTSLARTILEEFAEHDGIVDDLGSRATVLEASVEYARIRLIREIQMEEHRETRTVSSRHYQFGGSDGAVPYEERYQHLPVAVERSREQMDVPESGWAGGSIDVDFEQKSGCASSRCRRCDGETEVTCRRCDGSGWDSCGICTNGKRPCKDCDGGQEPCGRCKGTGTRTNLAGEEVGCNRCPGTGTVDCDTCKGLNELPCSSTKCRNGEVPCPKCEQDGTTRCPGCKGSGRTVEVIAGTISYTPRSWYEAEANAPVPVDILRNAHRELVHTHRESAPRSSVPDAIERRVFHLRVPVATIRYEYGGSTYELYKIGRRLYYDTFPHERARSVRGIRIATLAFAIGGTLLFAFGSVLAAAFATALGPIASAVLLSTGGESSV